MILNKKKRDDALKQITAVLIIVTESVRETSSLLTATDNLIEIAFDVGGVSGMAKIKNMIDKYWEGEGNDRVCYEKKMVRKPQ